MNDNLSSLSAAWTEDASSLVRVIPIDSFKSGFVVMAHIGQTAEKLGYYPEITITTSKLTIVIPDDLAGTHFELAKQIDELIPDGPDA